MKLWLVPSVGKATVKPFASVHLRRARGASFGTIRTKRVPAASS